ncbi:MATE family efflux transporter [Luteithermobacter gelatinilyticus]|uniref:MATE family efflux transporter n=1 Tax=Luteithermobacter gelatinilyticus TaxID=2582913 RepID=UPI001106CFD9|nr:MATE family efflux transporter [Luteithermobacter gelatinilyticus]
MATNSKKPIHRDLTQGAVHKHLLDMALPMVIGIFCTMAFINVDLYFVGQLGPQELAAVGYVSRVAMVVVAASIGLSAGTSSVLARAYGQKDHAEMIRLSTNAFLICVIFSLTFTVVGLLTVDPLFTLIGADEKIMPLIRDYVTIWYFSTLFIIAPMVGQGIMRAMGNTILQTHINIWAAVANAILDPILIFGLLGFPRLELEGAALATLIARGGSFLAIYGYLYHRFEVLQFSRKVISAFRPSLRKILHVGLPAAGTNMIIPIAALILIAIISEYGVKAVAGTHVATSIESLAMIFFFALSAVIGPFAGQNLGAHQYERIEQAMKICAVFCVSWGIVLAVLIALVAEPLASLFNDDARIVEVATAYLSIVPLSYGAYGFVMTANATFNGLGKPLPGVMISTLRTVVLPLPLIILAAYYFNLPVIFAVLSAANLVTGLIAYIWIRRTIRRLA